MFATRQLEMIDATSYLQHATKHRNFQRFGDVDTTTQRTRQVKNQRRMLGLLVPRSQFALLTSLANLHTTANVWDLGLCCNPKHASKFNPVPNIPQSQGASTKMVSFPWKSAVRTELHGCLLEATLPYLLKVDTTCSKGSKPSQGMHLCSGEKSIYAMKISQDVELQFTIL